MTEFFYRLKVGVSYRSKEAIYGILQFGINEQLQIGYSYDHSLSAIRKYQKGNEHYQASNTGDEYGNQAVHVG